VNIVKSGTDPSTATTRPPGADSAIKGAGHAEALGVEIAHRGFQGGMAHGFLNGAGVGAGASGTCVILSPRRRGGAEGEVGETFNIQHSTFNAQ
jgi:hypothetical protein